MFQQLKCIVLHSGSYGFGSNEGLSAPLLSLEVDLVSLHQRRYSLRLVDALSFTHRPSFVYWISDVLCNAWEV